MKRELPKYVHEKHGALFYVRNNKWTRLADSDKLADALAEYARLLEGKPTDSAMMMPDFIEAAFPHIIVGKSADTERSYRSRANTLKNVWEKLPVAHLKPKHIFEIRRKLTNKPDTFNLQRTVLNLMMVWAIEKEIVEVNPCRDVPRLTPTKRTFRLTHVTYDSIYGAAADAKDERMQIVMDLCYRTGQRIRDVLNYRESQITPEGMFVRQHKTGALVLLGWTPELRAAVDRARAYREGKRKGQYARNLNVVDLKRAADPFLFKRKGGTAHHYMTVYKAWRRLLVALGIDGKGRARIHDMRAKSATDVVLSYGDAGFQRGLEHANRLLGHKTLQQTRDYFRAILVASVEGPTERKAA